MKKKNCFLAYVQLSSILFACSILNAGEIVVTTSAEKASAVNNAVNNTDILIADGTYLMTSVLVIGPEWSPTGTPLSNVSIRSQSGNRAAVVLHGPGMTNGSTPRILILIRHTADITIEGLTLRDVRDHLIQVQGEQNPIRTTIRNVHLVDAGDQFIKVSLDFDHPERHARDGIIQGCLMEYSGTAPDFYTGAIDAHGIEGWVISANTCRNFVHPAQLVDPAILVWSGSIGTIVEKNLLIECERGIMFGEGAVHTSDQHIGGIIRNNIVYRTVSGDTGISLNQTRNVGVYHNTVLLNGTFPWAIEYRFQSVTGEPSGTLSYNLTDNPIAARDNAEAQTTGNIANALSTWFADPSQADFHLTSTALPAIDAAVTLPDVPDDYDGTPRPVNSAPDIGAQEFVDPDFSHDFFDLSLVNETSVSGVLLAWYSIPGIRYTLWVQSPLTGETYLPLISGYAATDAVSALLDQGNAGNGIPHPSDDPGPRLYKLSFSN
ncbi:right-handed parallel beta-helix repeat-containing protein [bacterium]|nr:right-handed parallel beta-helix repeat-containing protein [bacterium]